MTRVGCLLTVIATLMLLALAVPAASRGVQPAVHPAAGLRGAPPEPSPVAVPVANATAGHSAGGAPLRGRATWYDAPSRSDAAAGPALRDLLGSDWRGSWVQVCRSSTCTTVRLTDWCACGPRDGRPTLLDLDDRAFRELAPLSRGVVSVSVEPVGHVELPETDTDGPVAP